LLAETEDPRRSAIERLRRDGVTPAEIIDQIIPGVARLLGQMWADDAMSFADVTIGTARLQETVRRLHTQMLSSSSNGLSVNSVRHTPIRDQHVLLVIPRSEHHTLGTFVAADQLRRFGYDVDIVMDEHPRQIATALRKKRYVMVGITAAGRRTLASARELVDIIRATATRVTPVVLGGSLVSTGLDLKQITGVDHVANDIETALRLCGLGIVETAPSGDMGVGRAE